MYLLLCLGVFATGYLANMVMITVCYHRGLAHGAVKLSPFTRKVVIHLGLWITGLTPKAWAVMHRRHHEYSDTPKDPHSPSNVGLWGVMAAQAVSYYRTMEGLDAEDPEFTRFAHGLDFDHTWAHNRVIRTLPYVLHTAIAVGIFVGFDAFWLGLSYFVGLMSHPIQGFLVNSLGHAVGGRNFETTDDSTNNAFVGLVAFGEGYQNNHHAYPRSAKFSFRPWEFDAGFVACVLMEAVGLLRIDYPQLIPDRLPVAALTPDQPPVRDREPALVQELASAQELRPAQRVPVPSEKVSAVRPSVN